MKTKLFTTVIIAVVISSICGCKKDKPTILQWCDCMMPTNESFRTIMDKYPYLNSESDQILFDAVNEYSHDATFIKSIPNILKHLNSDQQFNIRAISNNRSSTFDSLVVYVPNAKTCSDDSTPIFAIAAVLPAEYGPYEDVIWGFKLLSDSTYLIITEADALNSAGPVFIFDVNENYFEENEPTIDTSSLSPESNGTSANYYFSRIQVNHEFDGNGNMEIGYGVHSWDFVTHNDVDPSNNTIYNQFNYQHSQMGFLQNTWIHVYYRSLYNTGNGWSFSSDWPLSACYGMFIVYDSDWPASKKTITRNVPYPYNTSLATVSWKIRQDANSVGLIAYGNYPLNIISNINYVTFNCPNGKFWIHRYDQ